MQLQSIRFVHPVAGPGKGSSAAGSYSAGEVPAGASVNAYTWLKSIELTRDGVILTDKKGRVRRTERSNVIEYEQVGDHLTDEERADFEAILARQSKLENRK